MPKRTYPTYQPPNYRGMPGTTPPFIPEPIPQGGQIPAAPQPDPALPPYMQQPAPGGQPQQQDPRTIMQKLRDPRFAGMLLSMGAALGQPKQFGQTGWGQAAQAMAQGYNFLGMSQAAQEAAKRQHWEDQIRMQDLAMKQQKQAVDIDDTKAATENKKNADIFKRQESVREDRKADTNQTNVESQIRTREGALEETAKYHREQLTAAELRHKEAMAREERMFQQNASREERLAAQAETDKAFKEMEAKRRAAQDAATASYRKQDLQIKQQNANSGTTRANAAATKATTTGSGRDMSNPEMIRLMGIVKNDPENFGISEEELVVKAQKLFDALPNQKSKPAGPRLSLGADGLTVDVDGGQKIVFPSKQAAMTYIERKSKERK